MMNLHSDTDKIETLICLESLLDLCYQALAGLVHNQTVRKECQQFEEHAQYRQEELKKIFSLSQENEDNIENKIDKYVLKLKPLHLPMRALINLAINLTAFKIDIYKHLCHMVENYHELLDNFLEENIEEIDFFASGKEIPSK